MIRQAWQKLFRARPHKPFGAWQIELTTRCPLRCPLCVRAEAAGLRQADMPLERIEKLLPSLPHVETVVLEGWGESLLHPDLAEIIRRIRGAGPEVGFVTSGLGLTERRAAELVAAGVDFVGLSLAGATEQTHGRLRPPSRLSDVLAAARWFREGGERLKAGRPRLHFVYLLAKDNLAELPLLPELAAGAGVTELVLIHLIQISGPAQEAQRAFACGPAEEDHQPLLDETARIARRLGIRLRRPPLRSSAVAVCSEDPLRNLYVSVGGEVAPCVFLYPPVASPFPKIFCGRPVLQEMVSFGNLFQEDFDRIWNGPAYIAFRGLYLQRQRWYEAACAALAGGSAAAPPDPAALPAAPAPCLTCHKLQGV
jgi:MoaA/NifB/PqqE/SkfB family radical SAM enzyme